MNNVCENVSRRALAEIVNGLSVEIIIRRDVAKSPETVAALQLLFMTYSSFLDTWKTFENTDPVTYAHLWDLELSKCEPEEVAGLIDAVQETSISILQETSSDIMGLLPDFTSDSYAESKRVLEHVVELDHAYMFASMR